jgi:superfamily I DNA/RNA helicase
MIEYQDIPIYIINGMFGILKDNGITVDYKNMELAELNFIPDFLDQNSQHLILKPKCFKSIFEQYTKDPSKEAFISELYNDKIEDDALQDVCMIDFGYAASVHKYQGSEADNVLLVVEDKIPGNIFFRWLYTGITRAKKSITVATVS